MIINRLYYEDSYKKSFTAVVTGCERLGDLYSIVLDATAFYPEGGGQPADTGHIGEAAVIDVKEIDDVVIHYTDLPVTVGSEVLCIIDWERRFSFMQQHTGEHIISGVINSLFGYENVGFHMGIENVTMDINGALSEADINKIEILANNAVYENIAVKALYPSQDELDVMQYRSKKILSGDVRIVSIQGYDNCACCGLHCANTGEVGIIKLLTAQRYKGGTRINVLCGMRALLDYSAKNKDIYSISALLSAKPVEVTDAVKQILHENSLLKQQVVEYKINLFEIKANEVPLNTEKTCFFEEDLSPNDLRRFCMLLCERAEMAAVFSGKDGEYKYAVGSHNSDMRTFSRILNSKLNGKGGGQKELVQGTVYASRKEIEELMEKYK